VYKDTTVSEFARQHNVGRNKLFSFLKWYKVLDLRGYPMDAHKGSFSQRQNDDGFYVYDLTSKGEREVKALLDFHGKDEVDKCHKRFLSYNKKWKVWETEVYRLEDEYYDGHHLHMKKLDEMPQLHDEV